uniref:Aminotransferase-like plant mobile domain-containing protein n=1 Tax=Fagus sylvatica TaxID=28930 RepID=A0A2N9EQH2_FAGSY
MAAILIHVLLRLSFYLWLKLYPSRESALAHLPRLPMQKSLGNGHWHQVNLPPPPIFLFSLWLHLLPYPPHDTAMASGGDSEIPTADTGTIVAGSVESVDGSRFSPVPEDDREDFVFPLLDPWSGSLPFLAFLILRFRGEICNRCLSISSFPCSAAADWFHWVADEFLDVKFCALLERAGVAEAILLSRSCNMYRDTEMLRQILRRWCTSTHTFFFSWGELTITLEDVENHWLLPVLGDMDPFAVEMSEEETLVEQALMARSSTRINAWSLYFAKGTEPAVRRAAFVAYWLCKCVFGDAPYYSMKPLYFRLAVKISFGHRFPLAAMFLGYLYLQLDSICLDEICGGSCHFITTCFNTSALQTFLWERSLNYQEVGNDNGQIREKFRNMSLPHFEQIPGFKEQSAARLSLGFSCHSVLYWFSDIASQSFELFPDDTRSLTYLSAVNPGWLPVWSDKGVEYTHYCANRVRRQFGLDQGVPGSPSETLPRTPSIAPFLNDRAFDYWSQSVSRMVIPCGGRLGICTVAMQEYWLRVAVAMADYVNQGRGTRVPLSNHHAHPVETMTLSPPTQTAISYADRQNLGFAEWDGSRDGWILYSTKFPSGWKESVKVVEERLRLDSKRGKGGKKIDSSKELGGRSLMAPGTSKKSAAGTSKSQKKPAVGSLVNPTEDTSIPSKETESSAVQEEICLLLLPKANLGSPVESATPIEKESAVPTPPSTMYGRTRSKRKAAEEQVKSQAKRKVGDEAEGSDWTPIVIEEVSGDDDIVDAGVGTTEVNEGIVERQEDETLGVTVSDEAVLVMADEAVQSTTSIMAEEVPGEIPVSMADVVRVDEAHEITSSYGRRGPCRMIMIKTLVLLIQKRRSRMSLNHFRLFHLLTSVMSPVPLIRLSFHSNPPFARMASVMEGISLFGVAPRFERIFREESSPMVVSDRPSSGIFIGGQVPALEGTPIQDADDGGMADTEVRGVDVVPEDVETPVPVEEGERCSCSVCGCQFLSDAVCSRGDYLLGGLLRFLQDLRREPPILILIGTSGNSKAHWLLMATFGCIKMLCPFCRRLTANVLADMRRTSFKTLSEPKIFSWRSVVQDLIAVGFDLDFMLEHLRKVARKFFGEAIASEMKIVQEQISSLQSTLAVLVSYQGELMSAAAASPEVVEVASPIDGLFD